MSEKSVQKPPISFLQLYSSTIGPRSTDKESGVKLGGQKPAADQHTVKLQYCQILFGS